VFEVRLSYTLPEVQITYCRNNNAEARKARKITAGLKGKFHILGFFCLSAWGGPESLGIFVSSP
jgi:hypothetical protein